MLLASSIELSADRCPGRTPPGFEEHFSHLIGKGVDMVAVEFVETVTERTESNCIERYCFISKIMVVVQYADLAV